MKNHRDSFFIIRNLGKETILTRIYHNITFLDDLKTELGRRRVRNERALMREFVSVCDIVRKSISFFFAVWRVYQRVYADRTTNVVVSVSSKRDNADGKWKWKSNLSYIRAKRRFFNTSLVDTYLPTYQVITMWSIRMYRFVCVCLNNEQTSVRRRDDGQTTDGQLYVVKKDIVERRWWIECLLN